VLPNPARVSVNVKHTEYIKKKDLKFCHYKKWSNVPFKKKKPALGRLRQDNCESRLHSETLEH
jgi:hypothetical protein